MKTMKRIAAAALMLCILAAMLPMAVSAATTASGTFGTDVNWVLEGTTLTISGSGAMKEMGILSNAPWYDYRAAIKNVVIEDGITSIGERAFYNCTSLISVTIADSVWNISENAFHLCSALTEITIPDSVVSMGGDVFRGCSSLKNATLSNNINTISNNTFYGCKNLTNVSVSDELMGIGKYAFYNCSSLIDFAIPQSVTSIGSSAFYGCSSLTDVEIPNGISSIPSSAFYNCDSLTSVKLPDSVTQIEENAFQSCNKLASITLPAGISNIGNSAFSTCNKLKAVFCLGTKEVKDNLTVGYGNNAFNNAAWHFEVTDAQLGTNKVKHCAECDLYYLLDGTGADFADVSKTSWQIKHANYAFVRGLMAGKGTDNASGLVRFDPNSPITREEFVQVLYNAEGKPNVAMNNEFLDVQNTWYTKAVLWAKSKDIANGTPDGNFGVGKNITRQDLALMLYKYARLKGCNMSYNDGEINRYADGNKVSDYAKTAMNWAVKNGILSGKGNVGDPISSFHLDPAGTATRAECAAMLRNFMTNFGL